MSFTGLLRTDVEIWRASPSVGDTGEVDPGYALRSTSKCTTEGHGQTPDRVRVDARDYVCVFVDRGPRSGAPVRAGLRAVS